VLNASATIKTYGEELNDMGYDILLLEGDGTLVVGRANNSGLSHRIFPGKGRLIQTDPQGEVIWEKDYGGELDSMLYSPIQVGDDEYLILGDIAGSYERDEEDMYLVKVSGDGNEIWSHTYGGRGMDNGRMVRQTADGGFILVGSRADEFPTGNLFRSKIVLIKTDAQGNQIWIQTYGKKILSLGWGVEQTPDGGYIIIGWEAKTIPDRDVIAIKTDDVGEVEWSRSWDLDPGDRDGGHDLILTEDGHIVIAGVQSMDKGPRGAILIKLDLDGNEIWVKDFSEDSIGTEFWDIMEDSDGGYIMAGDRILSYDPVTGKGAREGLVIKTDPDGEVLWRYTFGGDEYESVILSSAVLVPGRGYIFVGQVIRSGEKYSDMLWLMLAPDVTTAFPQSLPASGKRIALASERDGTLDIYVMDFDSGTMTRLTNTEDHDSGPAWSPDGMRIAFMSERNYNHDIYVMNADGSNVKRLTTDPAEDFGAAWSPDGTQISFTSNRGDNMDIYVMDVDGSNETRLTDAPGSDANPAWSPDGTRIAFSSERDGDLDIYLMDADGSNVVRLTDNTTHDVDPSWSPDGKYILFSSNRDDPDPDDYTSADNNWEIYVMGVDGSDPTRLTDHPAYDIAARWSPDGEHIIFVSLRDGVFRIYRMDTDGSNLSPLTGDTALEESPAWSP
jgi:Tol biopolymer transport system component